MDVYNELIQEYAFELSPDICSIMIDKFEELDLAGQTQPGKIQSGLLDEKIKRDTEFFITGSEEYLQFDSILHDSLFRVSSKYLSLYGEKWRIPTKGAFDTGYQLQRTKPGEFYDWHNDFYVLPNGSAYRVLTFIWYLNDVQEGGHTEFLNGRRVKPEKGKLLIFPATWPWGHRGCEPVSETKYIITGWIYSVAS